jgi:mediator of RNA polymerase II transcription subunit 14
MPGILTMNNASGAAMAATDGDSKKRSFEGKLINGGPSQSSSSALAVSAPPVPTPDQFSELPPELAQIASDTYHPLSTLLLRVSQETYNALSETLQTMADMPVAQHMNGGMSNGMASHGASQENIELNRRKKLLLMKFAQDNRAKFIKLLVLAEWGKKASKDVAKLIDLYTWTWQQRGSMDDVDGQIERIKLFSSAAGERNPDITTALETLSTGKAPWMPTLGYIPPEPIASEHALKLLRYLNTSLSIRLNVHETLPRRLQHWRVESGRATFILENEFEFDVTSFVEDTSQQWWFADVRLLFSPAPIITTGSHFFTRIQEQANFILGDKGLDGLYDFFCNFVLTHKISILRSQALKLASSGWAGSLKVENVHRELVVSYWTDRPGKKNWVEIGISKNKPKNGKPSWRGPSLPSLTVRCFRTGVEMKDAALGFDWQTLSFDRMIKRVIANHSSDLLQGIRENLDVHITAKANSSESEPSECNLRVTLESSSNYVSLSLEPVTGHYILLPATSLTARAETAFNQGREPKAMANILTQLLAQSIQDLVQKYAHQLGWHQVTRQSLHIDVLKAAVKLNALTYTMYSPRSWSPAWVFAAVVDASGCSWWIFEIGGNGSTIDYAEEIKLYRPDGSSLVMSRKTLASLERVAVQLLSTRVTARQLQKENKPFTLRTELGPAKNKVDAQSATRGWVLYVHTADLLTFHTGEQPWLEPNLAIICQGLKPETNTIWHIVAGKMVKAVAADMQKLMAASPQTGFKFSEDGSFRILLSTPFGQDILGELRARLRDVNRLRSFASTLQKRQMRLSSSSLQRVQFQYGVGVHVAAVKFSTKKEVVIEILPKNPHHRVHHLLSEIANERTCALPFIFNGDSNGLDRFCTTLLLTRPLMTALNSLETNGADGDLRNPAIHVHSAFKYRITYENPVCTFDVRALPKDDKVFWFIEDNMKKHTSELLPTLERGVGHRRLDSLVMRLKELFTGKGVRWFGTRNGMVAEIDGVGEALAKLNDVVLSCKMDGGYIAPPPLEVVATRSQQQQQQQQVNGQTQQQQQQHQTNQQRLQQQHAQARQQQAQQQGQRRPNPQQQNGRQQMLNARPQQHAQQNRQNGRPSQQQDVIEID